MAKRIHVGVRRSAREAREICAFLKIDLDGSRELRRKAHRRAATLAMLLRLYIEDERARLSRC